jgi:uncharacterized membrane protein
LVAYLALHIGSFYNGSTLKLSLTVKSSNLKWLIFPGAGILLAGWLWLTPGGLIGKADAIAYAVCHRIASHSLEVDGEQFPLCARCTGMYLGALLGLVYQALQGKLGKMPSLHTYIIMAVMVLAFGIDGVNSYLHFFPGFISSYQPQNWLRLITGTGMGLSISAVLLPAFHQTMWKSWEDKSALRSGRQLLGILILAVLLVESILSGFPIILFPMAFLSAIGVMVILTMIYSMVFVMLFKQENRFDRLSQLWFPLIVGFTIAILQISVTDVGRFFITKTWSGFSL